AMPEARRVGDNRRIAIDRRRGGRIVIRGPAAAAGCLDTVTAVIPWCFGELAGLAALLTSLHGHTLPGRPALSLILAGFIGWTLIGWVLLQVVRADSQI